MVPSRRIVAIVALAALALSACSSNDARESDLRDAMTDVGLTDNQADCVTSAVFDSDLSQDQLNDLAGESDPEAFSSEAQEVVDAAFAECDVTGGPSAPTDEDTEDTATTEATTEDTTTTTAG